MTIYKVRGPPLKRQCFFYTQNFSEAAKLTGKQKPSKTPVSVKPPASVQDSSGPEAGTQTLPQHSDTDVAVDSQTLDMSGSLRLGPSFTHPTGAATLNKDYSIVFTGPPEPDDVPLSGEHDSDHDLSDSLSDSQEIQLSDTLDRQKLTEEKNYRETVRSVCWGWGGIISPLLRATIQNRTRLTTLRMGRTQSIPAGYQLLCLLMTGSARS